MNSSYSSFGAPPRSSLMPTKPYPPDDLPVVGPDETEADVLNDETFGDCDLDTIKIKSDFGENGEFLGNDSLPDFFDSSETTNNFEGLSLNDQDDQSQQPSIDALLGEDPMRISLSLRPPSATTNPLFSMAISQARGNQSTNLFNPPAPPPPQPQPPPVQQAVSPQMQMNYAILKQYEQVLLNQQIPPREIAIHLQALIERMQRNARTQPMNNGHERNGNSLGYPPPVAVGEMMERARLTAMNTNNSRSQSPGMPAPPTFSSQLIDAIQRSDQIPIAADVGQRSSQSPSSPKETIVSPSHHRHNRPSKFYPRPPCLNTWQGRGPNHDEFAGMMSDLEKQRVVTIQLHQVSQTKDEDFYFLKWSQVRGQMHGTQLNRRDHRGQFIPYPIYQLLKSIEQEKELADRLSQSSAQATFTNVNPSQPLPYATPVQTQLGKQSIATPRHPRCTLHLDGHLALGTRANAITHDKYHLGLRLHVENIYQDLLRLNDEENSDKKTVLIQSIVQRYVNHSTYLFGDLFGEIHRARSILERLYSHLNSSKDYLELILIRFYASLSYMIHRYSTDFHIEPIVMNIISSMQQEILIKIKTFEDVYSFYNERIRSRLNGNLSSPFSDPILFTNSTSISILIEFLILMERRCYLPSGVNPSNLPIHVLQQLQPQLNYQLTEQIRLVVSEICQALLSCSTPKKMLKPFPHTHHQQFGLLLKFLRIQFKNEIYPTLESKLIHACVKSD